MQDQDNTRPFHKYVIPKETPANTDVLLQFYTALDGAKNAFHNKKRLKNTMKKIKENFLSKNKSYKCKIVC